MLSRSWELFFLLLVVANVAEVVIGTMPSMARHEDMFNAIDYMFAGVFSLEYLARMWRAPLLRADFAGWRGRLRYARTPLAVVDLLALMPALFAGLGMSTVLRSVRLLALFRLLRLMRYQAAAFRLRDALRARAEELVIVGCALLVFVFLAAALMYTLEHEAQPKVFASIPDALWWAVITVTTIGYGDIVPVTVAGKMVSSVCAFVGVLLIALPTSIVAGAFMETTRASEQQPKPEKDQPNDPGRRID